MTAQKTSILYPDPRRIRERIVTLNTLCRLKLPKPDDPARVRALEFRSECIAERERLHVMLDTLERRTL